MDKQLKLIGQKMRDTELKVLSFSERSKERVRKQMQQERVLAELLPLLIEEKSGIVLCKLLQAKREQAIDLNEGMIYTLLHEAEQNGLVVSRWYDNGEKMYQLTKVGLKQITKAEEKQKLIDLKGLWQEVRGV